MTDPKPTTAALLVQGLLTLMRTDPKALDSVPETDRLSLIGNLDLDQLRRDAAAGAEPFTKPNPGVYDVLNFHETLKGADALLNRPTTYSFKNSDTTSPAVRAGQYQRRRADAWYDSQIKELNP